ncbi:MAG: zinc ribbon domain-containing protein [Burkholderiaceae bacterium]|nr:zinc ribbon domain-containing protein [Burkholderiaceae bacterium]
MPIYAYKCSSCGHAQDVLQKMSDEPLTVCPSCHAASFAKQVTAAGFQLKGSGWYVTDFRDGGKKSDKKADGAGDGKAADAATAGTTDAAAQTKTEAKTEAKAEVKSESKTESKPAATSPES